MAAHGDLGNEPRRSQSIRHGTAKWGAFALPMGIATSRAAVPIGRSARGPVSKPSARFEAPVTGRSEQTPTVFSVVTPAPGVLSSAPDEMVSSFSPASGNLRALRPAGGERLFPVSPAGTFSLHPRAP
ncbi:hypothetical protein FTUN_7724 [Frigoriglobus tundricola]|uniref:Uncharacterized protein n=1 Tax=Frigoriglobus tundricola TaxID=2774151 RepID=A0A6M5Z1A1_9BACT|nr:hypothetical protein FTUN_7724 [Frigoriglobus tundricola]